MRKSSDIIGHILILTGLTLLLLSCEHKELCFDHEKHSPRYASLLKIEYDLSWEKPHENRTDWVNDWKNEFGIKYNDLYPHTPEGLRVMVWTDKGLNNRININPFYEEVILSPGNNSLLIYNNDTEHILFSDMDSYATASVTTRTRTRNSYTGNPLFRDTRDGTDRTRKNKTESTKNMPDQLFGYYLKDYWQNEIITAPVLEVTMHPLVYTYLVRYEFGHGLKYVALARGAMSGMAESVYLYDGHTSEATATLLYDCTIENWGVQAIVTSFGVPNFPNPEYTSPAARSTNFAINLELLLKNGKILNYYYDITDQLAGQPRGGVITIKGINVSDSDGEEPGGGAFDVDVDDWGEYEDIELTF